MPKYNPNTTYKEIPENRLSELSHDILVGLVHRIYDIRHYSFDQDLNDPTSAIVRIISGGCGRTQFGIKAALIINSPVKQVSDLVVNSMVNNLFSQSSNIDETKP